MIMMGSYPPIIRKQFKKDGTIPAAGDARCWDDLSAPIIAARLDTVSGRLEYDYFNGGVKMGATARYPEEPVVVPKQGKHAMYYGADAVARPHIHWLQNQAAIPNFLMGYKLTNFGEPTTQETDWSNYTLLTPIASAFNYAAGTFPQITMFPEIDLSSATISFSFDVVVFRDSANASGLFAGADPVATDVTVKYVDSHVMFDQLGSDEEYIKDGS